MAEQPKAKVPKYEGEFKQFGRQGKVMDIVLKDVKAHKALENTVQTIAERCQKNGTLSAKNAPLGAVKNALAVLQGMNRVVRYPVGTSALYESK